MLSFFVFSDSTLDVLFSVSSVKCSCCLRGAEFVHKALSEMQMLFSRN